ncbi:MAG TPA: ABC transporter permease [Rhizomicrobium sp.]|nr:ABC transporter permease [Rhizomicrobium sp.]
MKYFPLVWAAIMRKPTRAILTLLSVVVAFTLFGTMIGLNATFAAVEAAARADRIFVNPRFGGPIPLAAGRQIADLPGIAQVGTIGFIPGYHQDKKNKVFVMMVDHNLRKVRFDWPLTPGQWDLIAQNRTGIVVSKIQATKWDLKPGDNFVVAAPQIAKADGTRSWTFKVLAVTNDLPAWGNGYIMGNFDFLDKARPLAEQGRVGWFEVLASDPTQSAELIQRIDRTFANSSSPLQSITEKAAYQVSNSGIDITAVTRDIALSGLFMILFLTANGIAQSVRERFAEFATLKTIGFSDRAVLALVVLEAALPCMIGAALGVGVAAIFARLMPRLFPPGFGLPLPTMTPMVIVWAVISAGAVALASAALPARRLSRMDIATALSGR